jgi:peptidoglycan/LPS O-acetylase OafA/YrhL
MDKAFDPRLESLRGIAAFGVAWTHANMVFLIYEPFSYPSLLEWRDWIFQAIPAGAAVVLFFVLSGFVLGNSLKRDANPVRFAIRRIFRIFPALWLAVLLTYTAQVLIVPSLDRGLFTDWFINVFLLPVTIADLFRNLVLAKKSIDPVIWSLIPEVACSLMLPALVWLHQRTGQIGRFAILLCLAVAGHYSGDGSTQYMVAFYAGFSLPEIIAPWLNSFYRAAIAAIAGWLLLCLGNKYGVPYTSNMREVCTVGAVILISSIVAAPDAFRFLNARPLRFIGRLSFSFYLLHLPALFLLSATVLAMPALKPQNECGAIILATASVMMALCLAALSHRFIELPGIALGRRIADDVINLARTQRGLGSAKNGDVPNIGHASHVEANAAATPNP